MAGQMITAEDVKRILGLQPHPREGGWYVRTYESDELLVPSAFAAGRYPGPRRTGTAIYYLLEPHTFSEMHRLRSDEVFHFYAGDPVEMLQLAADDNGAPKGPGSRIVIGKDLLAGERPQAVVGRSIWQGSRLVPGGRWALLGCSVSPGFEFEDYEDVPRRDLLDRWPGWHDLITALTRS